MSKSCLKHRRYAHLPHPQHIRPASGVFPLKPQKVRRRDPTAFSNRVATSSPKSTPFISALLRRIWQPWQRCLRSCLASGMALKPLWAHQSLAAFTGTKRAKQAPSPRACARAANQAACPPPERCKEPSPEMSTPLPLHILDIIKPPIALTAPIRMISEFRSDWASSSSIISPCAPEFGALAFKRTKLIRPASLWNIWSIVGINPEPHGQSLQYEFVTTGVARPLIFSVFWLLISRAPAILFRGNLLNLAARCARLQRLRLNLVSEPAVQPAHWMHWRMEPQLQVPAIYLFNHRAPWQ